MGLRPWAPLGDFRPPGYLPLCVSPSRQSYRAVDATRRDVTQQLMFVQASKVRVCTERRQCIRLQFEDESDRDGRRRQDRSTVESGCDQQADRQTCRSQVQHCRRRGQRGRSACHQRVELDGGSRLGRAHTQLASGRRSQINRKANKGNSVDKPRHPRSDAYSEAQVLLNKQQIWCGGAYLHCYPSAVRKSIVERIVLKHL